MDLFASFATPTSPNQPQPFFFCIILYHLPLLSFGVTMHLCFSALRYHCTCWVPAGCEVSEDGTLDPDLLAACMRPDQARRCQTHTHTRRGDLHTHTYTEAHSRASLTIMQGFRCAVLQYNTGMDADKFEWSLWNNARNDTEAAKKLIEQA